MHRVPHQGVVLDVFRVSLHRGGYDGGKTDKHCDGKDEDQEWQQDDEGKRAEDEAQRDCFPAKLLELETNWRGTVLTVFDKNVVAP